MPIGLTDQQVLADADEGAVVHRGYVTTVRCANASCNHPVAQVHSMGLALFRVMCCPACGRATEVENSPIGWTVKLLPKRAAIPPKPSGGRNLTGRTKGS